MQSKDAPFGLSPSQMALLQATFAPFARQIEAVLVFGSRAMGLHKPSSDIDLVIYGPIAAADVDRIWTQLEESTLPFKADVVAYNHITNPLLRWHIDREAKPLFSVQR